MLGTIGSGSKAQPEGCGNGAARITWAGDTEEIDMRKILAAAAALAIGVGVPTVALASTSGNTSALDLQASKWTTTTQQTTGTAWHSVTG